MTKNQKKKTVGQKKAKNKVVLPEQYQTVFNRAIDLHRRGHLVQADQLYQAILKEFPGHADSWHLLGVLASALGKYDISVDLINNAIKINSGVAEYFYNIGIAYHSLGLFEKAVDSFRSALRLKPSYTQAFENLGVAYQDSGKYGAALTSFQSALELNPNSLTALNNIGTLFYRTNKTFKALESFDRALSVSPADADIHLKRFSALMRLGLFDQGWSEHEWRLNAPSYRKYNSITAKGLPRWDGCNLSDKSVLVVAEQGIGDEIMFAKFFPQIIEEAKECVIECDPRLVNLYRRSFPGASGIAVSGCSGDAEADVMIFAGSFPSFSRPLIDEMNDKEPFLIADNEKRAYWRERLKNLPSRPINIGITWRGGIDSRAVKVRSARLNEWKKLFTSTNANFINLQYGDHQAEIDEFNNSCENPLINFDELDAFNDIENLCALITELDLVISVDNATVHFAGALGKPVWILTPQGNEWRWLENRDDTVWYPHAKLFRNLKNDSQGWKNVLEEVANALEGSGVFSDVKGSSSIRESKNYAAPLVEKPTHQGKSCLLLNDTSNWNHWGSSCTGIGIYQELRSRGWAVEGMPIHLTNQLTALPESIEAFDSDEQYRTFEKSYPALLDCLKRNALVVINGEGTLHAQGAGPVGLLYLAYICKKRLGKKVAVINHSCYPNDVAELTEGPAPKLYAKVYECLDYIAVREPISHELLKSMGIDSHLSFDCLPLFVKRYYDATPSDKESKTLVVCGSVAWGPDSIATVADFARRAVEQGFHIKVLVGAAAYMASDDVELVRLLQEQATDQFELMYARSEQEWLQTIANASLLVSGRFHHSIAAAFLGTPFLVAQSNTPKISGLLKALNLSAPLFDISQISGEELFQLSKSCLESPEDFLITEDTRQRLLARSLENFQFIQ